VRALEQVEHRFLEVIEATKPPPLVTRSGNHPVSAGSRNPGTRIVRASAPRVGDEHAVDRERPAEVEEAPVGVREADGAANRGVGEPRRR
jgi:hypothetical protein